MDESLTVGQIAFLLGIVIHFITFVGIFTKLEHRLTKLETLLEHIITDRQAPH